MNKIAMLVAGVSAMATWEGGPTYTALYEKVNNVDAYKLTVKGLKEGGFFAWSEGKPSTDSFVNTIVFTGTNDGSKQITDWYFQQGAVNFKKDTDNNGQENLESKSATKEADGTWTMSVYRKFDTGDTKDGSDITCGTVATWRWHGSQDTTNIETTSLKEGNLSVQFSVADCAMTVKDIAILAKKGAIQNAVSAVSIAAMAYLLY